MLEKPSYHFPAQLKLRSAHEYQGAFGGSIKLVAGNIKIFAKPNELSFARLGLAISRKKTRNAVVRNRIKRIVRESFRLQRHELIAVDVVVIILRKVDDVDNKKLQLCLHTLWQRLSKA